MPVLLQIWIVIVTVGLLAIAVFALRLLSRFVDKATSDLSQMGQAVRESATRIDHVSQEAGTLLASVRECVSPVLRVVHRFEAVGQRTADLSSTLLDEIEGPLYTASALARGLRSGTGHFLKRLMNRFIHRSTQGGHHHEG